MTALLPDGVREAIQGQSLYAASESLGVVALVVLVLLLLELEALRAMRSGGDRMRVLAAVVQPVLLAVTLTIVLRVAELLP